MEFAQFVYVPAIIRILTVFAGILIINRIGLQLGIALFIGGIAIDVWGGCPLAELFKDLRHALTRPEMWLLMLVVALIMGLGQFMAAERNTKTIMAIARRMGGQHGRAISVMSLPAVIGLMPMPGGALFSAPLVARAVHENTWPPEWKSAINYWFRHIWEYWWPLYPVVIVTLSIFEIEAWQYFVTLSPFSALAVLSGYLFLIRPHLSSLREESSPTVTADRNGWMLALPLLIVLLASLALPPLLDQVVPELRLAIRKLLAMVIGLTIGLGVIFCYNRTNQEIGPFRELLGVKSLNTLSTLAGVMIFQSMLDQSDLVPAAAGNLIRSGIPLVAVIAILPFIAGLVTGLAIGFAGISFPLIIGLQGGIDSGLTTMSTLALAFGFGYAGMMLSPVHKCLVLTKDYFSVPYGQVYRHILPCITVLLLTSVGLCAMFSMLAW